MVLPNLLPGNPNNVFDPSPSVRRACRLTCAVLVSASALIFLPLPLIKLDLLLLNMTAFHVFDQLYGDPTTSALLTFLLDR